jgi:hypothetical protein
VKPAIYVLSTTLLLLVAISFGISAGPQKSGTTANSYFGFDMNTYPGDDALPLLKQTFSFASYWLSAPPGEKINSWTGKRKTLPVETTRHAFAYVFAGSGKFCNASGPEIVAAS